MHLHKQSIFILLVIVVNINGYFVSNGFVQLTTAKRQQAVWPKPINPVKKEVMEENESAVDESLSAPSLYVSKSFASRRRMGSSDIWSWELWCELQARKGNCSDQVERFYYNAQVDQCMSFTYSGCGGNNNSFDSVQKCERFCSGAPYESLKEDVTYFCEIQPDVGICLDLTTKYYYDVNEANCKEFQYGGCGGNRNRFDTKEACLAECDKSSNV